MRRNIEYERIELGSSALSSRLFAHYYHAPSTERQRPLVCYWGGALSAEDYERERIRPPDVVVSDWFAALAHRPRLPDLIVLSVPNVPSWSSTALRRRALQAFYTELLPASPNPRPIGIAYVGYSAGAFLATCLALDVPAAAGLATLGGVGMTIPLLDTPGRPIARFPLWAFSNTEDPCSDQTVELVAAWQRRGLPTTLHRRPGGHDIADYAANGSLRASFTAAVGELRGLGRPRRTFGLD